MKKTFFIYTGIFVCIASSAFTQQINDTIKLSVIEVKDNLIKKTPYVSCDVGKLQIQSTDTRDIGDLLRSIPNVSGIRKGGVAIDPVIRGFKFSQLSVILDNGINIEGGCPNRMDPVTAHVEAEDIEKIEVIKGPFVLGYSPVFGGIINLVTSKPHPYEKFELHASALYGFETNWNGQEEHISIYGGNKKVFFNLSGGYRNYGNYESGNLEGHDTTFNSSFKKYNYTAELGFIPKKNHTIFISYNEIHGFDVMYPCLGMDEKSDDSRIISLDYNIKNISNTIKTLDVKIYRSDGNHVMDNSKRPGYSTKQMISDVDAVTTGFMSKLVMQFKKHKLIAGADYVNIYKDGTRTMTMQMMGTTSVKNTNLWYDGLVQNAGIFAEYSTILSSYEINASVRGDLNKATSGDTLKIIKNGIDYFNDVNSQYMNFSASLGVTKKINEWFDVSLAVGRGTRSPNMTERYIKLLTVGYDNYDYLGNPQLKPETNNEIDLTFKFAKDNIGGIYLNGFYSHVQDYITANKLPLSIITPQTQGVLGVKQFVNTKYVTFMGCEFGYTSPNKYKFGGSVVAAYTYAFISAVTKYIVTGTQVTDNTIIKNDALPEIPPLEGTINVYYKFLKGNLIPKITFRAVADQRHVSDAFYEPYTPGFGLLNFSVKYKLNKYANITAGINNIFDRAYYEHLNRKIIGTTGKLYEPGRIFFVNLYVDI